MPSANVELLISQGEYFEYSFLYELGGAPLNLQNWGASLVFSDVNGVVLETDENVAPEGTVELSDGTVVPTPEHNVRVILQSLGTVRFAGSGEYQLILYPNPLNLDEQPDHIIRGSYKVQTRVGG